MALNKRNINNIFYIFVTTHLILWTVVPTITNSNLPLDTIEALAWGSNLDWGFNKHPPLSAFFPEVFFQIFVVSSFFIVWIFSNEFFKNKILSLISVLLLEGIYFYNFTTPEFNVNICQLPFWALSVLYAWKGFKDDKILDWILFGLFAALGVLSKYLFIYLLVGIDLFFIYMIVKKKINLKIFISLIPFFLVLLPHLIWLVENNYITINYGIHRTGTGGQDLIDHFLHPVIFLGKQIGVLIPFLLMFLLLVSKSKTKFNFKDKKLLFLLSITVAPVVLMLLTSLIMGVKIRTMWMTPFYLFFGVLVIYIFQSQINLNKLKGFTTVFLILFIFSPFAYSYVSVTKTDKRTDYLGKDEAKKAIAFYKNQSEVIGKIAYVKGNEWIAGNLSYHLKERPKWIYDPYNVYLCNKNLKCKKYK